MPTKGYRKGNEIITDGDTTLILVRSKGNLYSIIVDTVSIPELSRYTWCMTTFSNGGVYAATREGKNILLLHRLIMNVNSPSQIVDHKNGQTLDNRRSNLRITDKVGNGQNILNTNRNNSSGSSVRGVSFSKTRKVYVVRLSVEGVKNKHFGQFKTLKEAEDLAIRVRKTYMKLSKEAAEQED